MVAVMYSRAASCSANSASLALSSGVQSLLPAFQSVNTDWGKPKILASLYSLPTFIPALVTKKITSLFCGIHNFSVF